MSQPENNDETHAPALRFDRVLDSLAEGVLVTDLDDRVLYINTGFTKITGYTEEELLGRRAYQVIDGSDPKLQQERNRARARGVCDSYETRIRHPLAGERVIENRASPYYDEAGRVVGTIAAISDVTARYEAESQRAEAEAELRRREQLFRRLIENAADVITIFDREGRIVYESPAVRRMIGYAPGELAGRSMGEVVHPDDLPETMRALRYKLEHPGEVIPLRLRVRHKNGSYRTIEGASVNLLDDPAVGGIVANTRDVTERDQTLERLRLSEERFRGAFNSAAIGMALVATDGRWLDVNHALAQMLGYARDEMLATDFQSLTHPEDLDADLREAERLLRGEIDSYQMEKRYVCKEGDVVWALLTVSLVRDGAGAPAHFVAQVQNISARKLAEERLRQAQRMEAVGRLAGGVAHDFNNMLAVITGYSEMLLRRADRIDERDRSKLVEINRAAERAAALTQQLLAFSRQQVLQPVVLDLNDLVRDTERMLRRLIGEHLTLATDLDSRLPLVRADRSQLELVVVNLVVNARDACPAGGTITITTRLEHVTRNLVAPFAEMPPGDYCVLAVTDTGAGMDERTRARVFEPFFTTKEQGKGTGLGLATVYGVVKQSGGFITVESAPGEGSTFRVYLPPAEGMKDAASRAGVTGGEAPRGEEVVLLVEDEPLVRRMTRDVLESHGYRVIEAEDGRRALEIADGDARIDLLLTDLVMPQIGGRELAARLRERQPDLPVLLMSGYTSDSGFVQRDERDERLAFIQKPFAPDALARKVRESLDAAQTGA